MTFTSFGQAFLTNLLVAVVTACAYTGLVIPFYLHQKPENRKPLWLQLLIAGLVGGISTFLSGCTWLLVGGYRFTGPYGDIRWLFGLELLGAVIPAGVAWIGIWRSNPPNENYYSLRHYDTSSHKSRKPLWFGMAFMSGFFALCAVLSLLLNAGISITQTFNVWGGNSGNAKAFAALANISYANGNLPPTDVNHIIQVTQGMASYAAQQVIGSSGHNWGSEYKFPQGEFTLQAVSGHLYWIAPMEITSTWNQFFHATSVPGFVSVDAEDAAATAVLRTNQPLNYFSSAWFGKNPNWESYYRGYSNDLVSDWTLEVDDSWHPYWTADLEHPTKGFGGNLIDGVILLDAISGHIQSYKAGQQPEWVDRIVPQDYVKDKISDWGMYHFTPANWPSNVGRQQESGDPELVYNSADHPVWLVPMTSMSGSDSSSTGIIVYSSQDPSGLYYHVAGLGVGDVVDQAFQSNPHNIRNYHVSYTQLYMIDGEPTYLCIFAQSNNYGEAFQAIGLMDARHPSGAYVVMASNIPDALVQYGQELQAEGANGDTASSTAKTVTVSGMVTRISAPITSGSTTMYEIRIKGSDLTFQVSTDLDLNSVLPLTQPGDKVTLTYIATGQTNQTVAIAKSFSNLSLS